MKILLKILLLFLLSNSFAKAKDLIISSSINPIHKIVQEIYGSKNSKLIINPDLAYHNYYLKKNDLIAISNSDLIFYVGGDIDKAFKKLAKNNDKFIKISTIKNLNILKRRDGSNDIDHHLWLDLDNSIKIAKFITNKICDFDKNNCKKYQKNLRIFSKKINNLKSESAKKLKQVQNKKYVIYHDGYQYFENYFNFKSQLILTFEEEELKFSGLRSLHKIAKNNQIKCMFNEANSHTSSPIKLAKKYQIKYHEIDIIGNKNDDYFELFTKVVDGFYECLK